VKPSIYIAHPSGMLTDHVPNGDGLIAYGFISRLAARGYDLHVAVDQSAVRKAFPENVHLHPLNLRARNAALRLLELSVRTRLLFEKLRRKQHFALVLQMNPVFPGVSLGMLGSRTPIVVGTYVPRWGFESAGFQDGYNRPSEKSLASRARDAVVSLQQAHADALLLTSPAAGNRLPRLGLDSPKVFFVPHGIDAEAFAPAEPPVTEKKILFLASVTERKGIFDLLKAFPRVLEVFPEARLTIAGPGDDIDRVKQHVSEMESRDKITFLGRMSREETAPVYRSHTLYCLPSYGEPWATTLLEAMASGLPIVSTSSGGTPYMVPASGGRLVAPGDVNALTAALLEVLGSPSLQKSMGEENRAAALERFAWDRVIDRLEEVYWVASRGRLGRKPQAATEGDFVSPDPRRLPLYESPQRSTP
jgi:L-malate glycosyltransferase